MRTKLLSLAIALFCQALALTASAADYVTVSAMDGSKVSFGLTTTPTVTFTTDSMVISAGSEKVLYPLTDYRIFTFTNDNETVAGIDALNTGSANGTNAVFTLGDAVHGEGLRAGSRVAVYSLGGQMTGSATVSANGSVDIPLGGQNGVFIVKSESKSFKFIKK